MGRMRLLAAVFLLLIAAVSLYGGGARENSAMSQADALIEGKEYDQAIALLSDFLKENPDHHGRAQARLQRIVQIRERYNEVANQLLDTLENEPENGEKILELSNILMTIESTSNPGVARFLDQVIYLAEINVYRRRFEQILAEGREYLELHDYAAALRTYVSGLELYQEEYFAAGYGEEAEYAVIRGLEIIDTSVSAFINNVDSFSGLVQDLSRVLQDDSADKDELFPLFDRLFPMMDEFIALKNDLLDTQFSFQRQLTVLQDLDPSLGDRSFLFFAAWLISGPTGQTEGMIGAIERFWRSRLDKAEHYLAALSGSSHDLAYNALVNNDFAGAFTALEEAGRLTALSLKVIRSYSGFLGTGDGAGVSIYGETVNREKAADFLGFRAMEDALAFLETAGNLASRGSEMEASVNPAFNQWMQGLIDTPAAIAREQDIRLSYRELINEIDALESRIGSGLSAIGYDLNNLADMPEGKDNPLEYLDNVMGYTLDLGNGYKSLERNSVIRQYTIANADMEKRVIARQEEFTDGSRLYQGIPQAAQGDEVYIARYPSEGLAVFTRMNQELPADLENAGSVIARYAAEGSEVLAIPEMSALYDSARELLARLLSFQSQGEAIIASARIQVDRAASLRYEGDRLFQAAQTSLNRNDFDAARSNLTRAMEQYQASLSVQDSLILRTTWDTQWVSLGQNIVRRENEVVVQDVRNLVNTARNGYYAGYMVQAEEALIQAQNRWRVTNVTDQPEVEYWLNLVRGALSLQSGRTIPTTAPLYAEMSQLLSDAKRNYDEGVRLLNSGRRGEGLARFSNALDKAREVRLMFPLNYDARLLELMIEQQTDPPAFNASFRQRLNEAIAGTRPNIRSLQSFADLQDLAAINPRYPEIQAIVTQAEIDMGYRPPPPNPRDLSRSDELARTAQVTVNARDEVRYSIAQAQIEEAIRLNPNNTQAQALQDQISRLMSGTGTIVLPSRVQNQYDIAVQYFNQGNYLRANAIVEQLLLEPDNQRSTLILELKRRIDAVL